MTAVTVSIADRVRALANPVDYPDGAILLVERTVRFDDRPVAVRPEVWWRFDRPADEGPAFERGDWWQFGAKADHPTRLEVVLGGDVTADLLLPSSALPGLLGVAA